MAALSFAGVVLFALFALAVVVVASSLKIAKDYERAMGIDRVRKIALPTITSESESGTVNVNDAHFAH